jgi:hypothetical protein
MQHAHVKRKENHMNPITLQEFYNDPALRRRLYRAAARERNRAVREGVAWLVAHLTPRRPARWIERLG